MGQYSIIGTNRGLTYEMVIGSIRELLSGRCNNFTTLSYFQARNSSRANIDDEFEFHILNQYKHGALVVASGHFENSLCNSVKNLCSAPGGKSI